MRYEGVWLPVTIPGEDCDHWSAICRPDVDAVPIYDEWGALAGYQRPGRSDSGGRSG